MLLEVLVDRARTGRTRQPQGPPERPAAFGELEAGTIGVQPRSPARHPATDVHDQLRDSGTGGGGDHPQQG
ncbi:hypothetical protein CTKZ_16040 [Cellulomonas algicola]|uniref:Uncharacterized protein n=1 Tax=Cellulomonas algicola TaxID=2071633 RepID=A0A401UZG4_9CELL|nr:hypothetical protein CTKZ_16040 [Cellulomonas algicola]